MPVVTDGCRMFVTRLISFLVLLVAGGLCASAQLRMVDKEKLERVSSPVLSQDSAAFAFETRRIAAEPINEDDGPKTFRYPFRNEGDKEISIDRIVTSCSCVTAVCPVSIIAPGESSEVIVTYYPKGHVGRFERRIYLYSNSDDNPVAVLRLSVDVDSGRDVSADWPVRIGPIRLRHAEITFRSGTKAVETISFINLSGHPLNIECEEAFMPDCLRFHTEPDIVPDGQEGEMVISYDPSAGKSRDVVILMLKGLGLSPSASSLLVKFDN
ncbi:MAG: DUF1573 domain-containing protein [Bacteroidales bacterium]|nr:DUF1573 domain-containing protein [Bacteroidales bacterium]